MSRRSKGKWGFLFNAIVIMLILTVYHMYTYFRDKAWNIESIKVSIVMVLAYILIGFVVQLVVNRRNRTEPGVLLDALVLVLLMGVYHVTIFIRDKAWNTEGIMLSAVMVVTFFLSSLVFQKMRDE